MSPGTFVTPANTADYVPFEVRTAFHIARKRDFFFSLSLSKRWVTAEGIGTEQTAWCRNITQHEVHMPYGLITIHFQVGLWTNQKGKYKRAAVSAFLYLPAKPLHYPPTYTQSRKELLCWQSLSSASAKNTTKRGRSIVGCWLLWVFLNVLKALCHGDFTVLLRIRCHFAHWWYSDEANLGIALFSFSGPSVLNILPLPLSIPSTFEG